MSSRGDEIAIYFADNAARLERTVAGKVSAPHATIEDACSFAWCELVRRDDIRLTGQGFWWLYRVATREAWRLCATTRPEIPCLPATDHSVVPEPVIEPIANTDVPALVEDRLRLQALARIPERRRRILLMHAAGFTYAEISRMTGATLRTVDRQLRRARQMACEAADADLATRERDVLRGLIEGETIETIAARIGITKSTAADYVHAIYRKLGVTNRRDAITATRRTGAPSRR